VADVPFDQWTESDVVAIRAQLVRITTSGPFKQSPRRQRFLEYLVSAALEGRIERLKGYTIGVEIFDRPPSFDPMTDPVVRVEAARLRDKLREYYEREGQADPVRIEIPKGSYTPHIEIVPPNALAVTKTTPPDAADRPSRPLLWPRPIGVVAAVGSALVLLLVGWSVWRPLGSSDKKPPDKPSLAVLPFDNIGGDPSWRRLADGITQDITIDLSQSKDLLVIARSSTEIYRDKAVDVRDVGRELGVHYVLQGSIQPGDNRIRITARLIDARSGENVWSTKYSRPVADVFDVQSEVTEHIAATLAGYEGAMAQVERKLIRRKPPSVLMAYEHYLLGVEAKHGGTSGGVTPEGLNEAERHFLTALEIDPRLTRAYVGLSYVYEYRLDLGIGVPAENGARLIEFANKAAALDANDAEAQMVLGHAFAYQGLAEQALNQFIRAEALAPSNADVLILIAWFLPQLDQSRRAVELVERALRLNPNYPAWYNQGLRYVYFFGGAFDKTVKYVKRVPNPNPLDFAFLASASAVLNDTSAAKAAAAELHERDPAWNVEAYLSDNGKFPEKLAQMFVDAARKADVPTCAPAERVGQTDSFIHLRMCDEERARNLANAKVLTLPKDLSPH
jgi:TolB-like protein